MDKFEQESESIVEQEVEVKDEQLSDCGTPERSSLLDFPVKEDSEPEEVTVESTQQVPSVTAIFRQQQGVNATKDGIMTNTSILKQRLHGLGNPNGQRSFTTTDGTSSVTVATAGSEPSVEQQRSEAEAVSGKEHRCSCGKTFILCSSQRPADRQCNDCRKTSEDQQRSENAMQSSGVGVAMSTSPSEQNCDDSGREDEQLSTEEGLCPKEDVSATPQQSQAGMKHKCECGKSFRFLCRLKAHKRSHTGEKQFVCEICGSAFVRSNYLICHKRVHTGERPFVCDICGATFTRSNNLNIHKRIHTGVKPFTCTLCSKSFGLRYDLITHMRSHSGEKPYACRICKKTFSQGSNCKSHERRHSGLKTFSCDICCASFSQSGQLRIHKRTHTTEKSFACKVCEKIFSTRNTLTTHMQSHAGETPVS